MMKNLTFHFRYASNSNRVTIQIDKKHIIPYWNDINLIWVKNWYKWFFPVSEQLHFLSEFFFDTKINIDPFLLVRVY